MAQDADISDLVYLVDFMFTGGPPPPCFDEADMDASGSIDISDLVYLVDFMFTGGPPPLECTSSAVFIDEYDAGVTYEAFLGSYLEAVQVDADSMYAGTQGLVVSIPDANWAGGAFTDSTPRDLWEYNALTFYAKASAEATLDVAGLGNDNTGTSKYTAEVTGLALTTEWQKLIIPIPDPSKLTAEQGLFYFAEGNEGGEGYQVWMDEIAFENLPITNPRPVIPTITLNVTLGGDIVIEGGTCTFDVGGGVDVEVSTMMGYFNFTSSDEAVVTVGGDGVISAVGAGTAELTAELGNGGAKAAIPALGTVTVVVSPPEPEPSTPAPTPTVASDSVVSLYSEAYTNETVNTWSAAWDDADVATYMIGADSTKKYTNLVFAGIEFTSPTVDVSAMDHFHIDVWTPNPSGTPNLFKVKLVSFGADGAWGGGDDTEHELSFDESTMSSEAWVGIDVPLASFSGLAETAHMAQMVISTDPTTAYNTVYLDNIYFYDSGLPSEPEVAAPSPTVNPDYVVSLYSDAYASATIDTWSAVWDQADVSDFVVDADNSKHYTNLVFAGVEFTSSPVDASAMTRFHMDVWTPVPTGAPALYKVKLVDFGADGAYGGGDDVEHELSFDETTMNSHEWVSIDIPLTDFTNLTTTGALAQMIISGDLGEIYVDNIYFWTPPPTEPQEAAPTPTEDAGDVVSLLSDAYTNHPVDTWSAGWDQADVSDFVVDADSSKHYTNLVFAGVEFTTTTLDASSMDRFHMDVWTPNPTGAPAVYKVKLVDFGADGAWGGGDDVEHELSFDETTMSSHSWVSIDIPLTDFTGLVTTGHLAQMIISGDMSEVWVDNIYVYTTAGPPTEPTTSAPTPTQDAGDVFSVFSDTYTSTEFDVWSPGWDMGDVVAFTIAADNLKKYTNWGYVLSEYSVGVTGPQDISSMTHFHMDVWTPDATDGSSEFKIKLVDFGADGNPGGGDDSEHELTLGDATMSTGSWVSLDIALADFSGMTGTGNFAQMILSGTYSTFFIDNLYFYVTAATEPQEAAPTPDYGSGSVVALYSDAYTNHPVDTWSAGWDVADVADFVVDADSSKQYTNLVFAGIEFTTTTLDASSMDRFHMDVWTPDATPGGQLYRVKLVDFGGDGAWGGGDDVEHELVFDETTMSTGGWVGIDVPLSDFTGLTTTGHLAQMIIASDSLSTVFMDNVYFYSTAPLSAATTPTLPSGDVISLYSDAYTDVTVDTWSAGWDAADVADVLVGSDNAKLYTNLSFAGIEFTSSTIDADSMTHFHIDVWTPDATGAPAVFMIKLVDFGGDGAWGGGDDVEHELTLTESTMDSGGWVSIELALSAFTGLVTKGHLAQMIISGDPNTMWVDNVYLHK
ncbi:MAG: hypothetical protein OEV49_09115 [candidate division Zixibacteria bacterium]|nr:hypothetical protein [candidate division Zixibacteria bacterium]MDH3935761.1 hypothetical protein [candidate division Zixibacteria bacterium]MDH4034396.1 hypothetical protein [candidate division Zixibacteria bacterium]